MATYAIGDIQGCYQDFMQLLDFIEFSPPAISCGWPVIWSTVGQIR